MIERKVVSVL